MQRRAVAHLIRQLRQLSAAAEAQRGQPGQLAEHPPQWAAGAHARVVGQVELRDTLGVEAPTADGAARGERLRQLRHLGVAPVQEGQLERLVGRQRRGLRRRGLGLRRILLRIHLLHLLLLLWLCLVLPLAQPLILRPLAAAGACLSAAAPFTAAALLGTRGCRRVEDKGKASLLLPWLHMGRQADDLEADLLREVGQLEQAGAVEQLQSSEEGQARQAGIT